MNRSQRRAKTTHGHGAFVELCLDGSCTGHSPTADGSPTRPPEIRVMRSRTTELGQRVLLCPWCSEDVRTNEPEEFPEDVWICEACGAMGSLELPL